MPEFAISAIGRDRPGIVAAISEALLGVEGNVEDSQMSILRGHFSVMLIVGVPPHVDPAEVERRLDGVRADLGLEALTVNRIDELDARPPRPSHVITVYGADHPGIVHAVSSALAERGVNITGLATRLGGASDSPLYVMTLEVALGDVPETQLEEMLQEAGESAAVEVSLRPLDVEAL
jgi:glycine cleavage system transcriptional repressor